MKILSSAWKTIGVAMFLFGIFWLPKDIEDWTEAGEPWKKALSMIDQNTALWIVSLLALLYVAYVEWLGNVLSNYFSPIKVNLDHDNGVNPIYNFSQITKIVENKQGANHDLEYDRFNLGIVVHNKSSHTVEKINARLFIHGLKGITGDGLKLANNETKLEPADLNPGENCHFQIGYAKSQTGDLLTGLYLAESEGQKGAYHTNGDFFGEINVRMKDKKPKKMFIKISKNEKNIVTCKTMSYNQLRSEVEAVFMSNRKRALQLKP